MAKLGKNWRMPSIVQVVELYQCCKVGKESVNGKTVTRFTGPNGNSIIFPWAGINYVHYILNYSPIALYGLSSAAFSAQSSYKEMLKSMCDEYNKKLLDIDKNKSSLPETIFSFRVDELKSMKSRIESFRETAITEIKKY